MADFRKRGRNDSNNNANGGLKKNKSETDSSGVGNKSKPCTKFYSKSGCPFGENCHFLHYVPGGYNAVAQMMNLSPLSSAAPPLPSAPNGASAAGKSRLCKNYNTAEGCKFGDKCHFAHGDWELNKPAPSFEEPRAIPTIQGHFGLRPEPPVPTAPTSLAPGFGASATAKISIDASLSGAIIGKGGMNSKQISLQTGVKLSIRDHEFDPNLRNIELEGNFDQIKIASAMVKDLVASASTGAHVKAPGPPGAGARAPSSNNYKTKLCEKFATGSCTFGEKCHFAHGSSELRRPGV